MLLPYWLQKVHSVPLVPDTTVSLQKHRFYNKHLLKHFPLRYAAIEPSDKMYFHFQNFPVHVTFTLTTIKAAETKGPLLTVYREVHSISLQLCIYFCIQHIDCTAQTILTLRTKHQRSHNDLKTSFHLFTFYVKGIHKTKHFLELISRALWQTNIWTNIQPITFNFHTKL